MTTKHTPGNWKLNIHSGGQYFGDIHSELGMVDGVGRICTVAVALKYAPPEQREANACLIAAAPAVLEALVDVRRLISEAAETGFNCADGDWADRLYRSQQKTSAAIRKATSPSEQEGG